MLHVKSSLYKHAKKFTDPENYRGVQKKTKNREECSLFFVFVYCVMKTTKL